MLILSGGKDELLPADHHAALVRTYPGAEERVFADLGHNLVLERPHEVGPPLVRFLSAGRTRGPGRARHSAERAEMRPPMTGSAARRPILAAHTAEHRAAEREAALIRIAATRRTPPLHSLRGTG